MEREFSTIRKNAYNLVSWFESIITSNVLIYHTIMFRNTKIAKHTGHKRFFSKHITSQSTGIKVNCNTVWNRVRTRVTFTMLHLLSALKFLLKFLLFPKFKSCMQGKLHSIQHCSPVKHFRLFLDIQSSHCNDSGRAECKFLPWI